MVSCDVLAEVEARLCEHFGHRPERASMSFVGVDPIEVLRFEPVPGERCYLTLGMSRHPMNGARDTLVADEGPRAELMLHLVDPADRFTEVWRRVALLGAGPAVERVVYTVGMSVDLGTPLAGGSVCTGVLVTESPIGTAPSCCGDVDVFQALPATPDELAWGRVRGSRALRARWHAAGTDLRELARSQVDLGES